VAILGDTGALELLRRRDRRVESLALRHFPPVVALHSVGEFLFGLANARITGTALRAANDFLAEFEILRPDEATARTYARLRAQLIAAGIKLPDPDYRIAAQALEAGLPLLSTDGDFRHISGLTFFHVPAAG
jgi:predicted nucleic acid-binding protein